MKIMLLSFVIEYAKLSLLIVRIVAVSLWGCLDCGWDHGWAVQWRIRLLVVVLLLADDVRCLLFLCDHVQSSVCDMGCLGSCSFLLLVVPFIIWGMRSLSPCCILIIISLASCIPNGKDMCVTKVSVGFVDVNCPWLFATNNTTNITSFQCHKCTRSSV